MNTTRNTAELAVTVYRRNADWKLTLTPGELNVARASVKEWGYPTNQRITPFHFRSNFADSRHRGMKEHRLRFAFVTCALIALCFLLFRPGKPRYQGRSLDSWVKDFHLVGGEQHEKAKVAVRHMGTNALPKLIKMLRYEAPAWKVRLQEWNEWIPIIKFRFQAASVRHWRAETALQALGPIAVPTLLDLVKEGKSGGRAWDALFMIGEQGITPLTGALTNSDPNIRTYAAMALASLESEGSAAVPALLRKLDDSDYRVREAVTNALRSIDPQAHNIPL